MLLLIAVALGAGFAATTTLFGWLAVPGLAFLAAAVSRARGRRARQGSAGLLAVGAALGWAALLALDSLRGPLWPLAERLAGVLRVPAIGLTLTTIAFAALLAWSAATVGGALTQLAMRKRPANAAGRSI